MRTSLRLLPALLLCLLSTASLAVAIPLPTKDVTLNFQVFIQPQFQLNENGAPNGTDAAYDLFVRRTRLQVNGDVGNNWSYYFQVDNANFGKFGNFTNRMIVQDAWVAFGPWGTKGDNVLLFEGGLVFYPNSRLTITSSANQPNVDGHPDMLRGFTASNFPATRTTGVQVRGWTLNKKVGFRGGVYEGVQPQTNPAAPVLPPFNPHRYPAVAGFVNLDIIGSEEGSYLYQTVQFGKNPVVSLSVAGTYQADALRTAKGITNQRSLVSTLYADIPQSEDGEFVGLLSGYLYGNGTGSRDTGKGFSADVGYRFGFVRPYVSWEYFTSDDCTAGPDATTAQCAQAHTADSRNVRAGFDFYINKAQNHFVIEGSLNRGQSGFGAQSINAGNAGYVPFVPAGQQPLTSLGRSASKSLTLHWSLYF